MRWGGGGGDLYRYRHVLSGYFPKRTESRVPEKYVYSHKHSIIHESRKDETPQANKMWSLRSAEPYRP